MSRKTIGAVMLLNAAATTAAVAPLVRADLANPWPTALAAGAFSAILMRLALALTLARQPAAAPARNVSRSARFIGDTSRLED